MTSGPISISATVGREALEASEWLLTNGLGGFAMGTAAGVPTRRYHAWLIASLKPPVRRVVGLHSCVERVEVIGVGSALGQRPGGQGSAGAPGAAGPTPKPQVMELSSYRFDGGATTPGGVANLVKFVRDPMGGCSWEYASGGVRVTRSLALARGVNAASVRYEVSGTPVKSTVRLVVRPLVALRDFHSLLRYPGREGLFRVRPSSAGVSVRGWWGDGPALALTEGGPAGGACRFRHDEQWWWNFRYEREFERGQDYGEDLFSPGEFSVEVGGATSPHGAWEMSATVGRPGEEPPAGVAFAAAVAARREHLAPIVARATEGAPSESAGACAALAVAADDFVVASEPVLASPGSGRTSVIAGYPWFADWGRDTLISLPGLMLATGRHAEAFDTLRTFASNVRAGVVPNRFDDFSGLPHYNTADASLWFVHAACEYLRVTGDRDGFDRSLKPACLEIVSAYQHGTSVPGDAGEQGEAAGAPIAMDPADGLIFAGSPTTQLTWMDAKRDGVVFTPRCGKPVELSALWHHALRSLSEALAPAGREKAGARIAAEDRTRAADLRTLADRVAASFRARFYVERLGYCADCLTPGVRQGDPAWSSALELRPNQLFAVSLEYSPLLPEQQRSVVAAVGRVLVTRLGVRTLDPGAKGYRGRYRGALMELDAAYHNGTAWPYLMGAYAEAVLRSGAFSAEARRKARDVLGPLAAFMGRVSSGAGDLVCVGQAPEVVDGDDERGAPQRAGGCPAQAWSVAECLRVMKLCGE